jgi:hypothetical protein
VTAAEASEQDVPWYHAGLRHVLICGLLFGVALVSWLLAGRRLVTLLDRVTLVQVDHVGVERLIYESGTLELGGKRVYLSNSSFARVAEISMDSSGRAVLESGGRRFPLGPGRLVSYSGSAPKFQFTEDTGDEVLFTVEQSRLAWPTPLEMNFMTGYSASRKRNVYLRLRWTKPGGAKLHMVWKTEQGYYSRDGWLPPHIETVTDGLIHVSIQEAKEPR